MTRLYKWDMANVRRPRHSALDILLSVINLEIKNLIVEEEEKGGDEDKNAGMDEFKKTPEECAKGKRGKCDKGTA